MCSIFCVSELYRASKFDSNDSGILGGATRRDERWLADLHEEVHPSSGQSYSAIETRFQKSLKRRRSSFHISLLWRKFHGTSLKIGEVLVQSNCSLLSSNISSVDILIDLCLCLVWWYNGNYIGARDWKSFGCVSSWLFFPCQECITWLCESVGWVLAVGL